MIAASDGTGVIHRLPSRPAPPGTPHDEHRCGGEGHQVA